MFATIGMAAVQAYQAALIEHEYVSKLPAAERAQHWADRERQAEISRQERTVRALEEIARNSGNPSRFSVMDLALGMALGSAT
jgi:hypothetical protein